MESHSVNNSLNLDKNKVQEKDYSKRAQWLRAAVLGANDGLVSTASVMIMAIGEFVSVYSQYDINVAQMKRESGSEIEKEKLPSPTQAAAVSALAFSLGAIVPLLAAAFVKEYKVRIGAIVASVTLALVMFGWLGAVLGKAPVVKSSVRVLVGGWFALAVTFGLTKLVGGWLAIGVGHVVLTWACDPSGDIRVIPEDDGTFGSDFTGTSEGELRSVPRGFGVD
ncbi:unnamed protein product [Microthlaspi erraticum]|uniref:Vacuolar iron transporter n=1 Tax=Microthlaspi erraticum TaxID=1685480 RepID=A0A6D2K5S7_9BRAS|nr:unnamed protein product [Microthlaspi erraticum]